MKRYYERYMGPLPGLEETFSYLAIAFILGLIGFIILRVTKKEQDISFLGCLGVLLLLGGIFCLVPILLWVERVSIIIIPVIGVLGFIGYVIYSLLKSFLFKSSQKVTQEPHVIVPQQSLTSDIPERIIEPDYDPSIIDANYFVYWWQTLSKEWKEIFKKNMLFDESKPEDLRRLHNIEVFSIIGKYEKYFQDNAKIEDLEPLKNFVRLKELKVDHACIISIDGLRNMSGLEKLILNSIDIEDLSVLKNLNNLSHLELVWCQKVKSLKAITHLNKLTHLDIGGTSVFNLEPISNLKLLRTLNLHNLKFLTTLSPLKNLYNLKKICLFGVSQLKSLNGVEDLYGIEEIEINGTSITDIAPFLKYKNLKYLDTMNTAVSKERLQVIKNKFPDAVIF